MANTYIDSSESIPREATGDALSVLMPSQTHLLKPTSYNPLPTAVPPPLVATAGTLGARHVLNFIGTPEVGKAFIAKRLAAYLSFFHGAQVKVFDLVDYLKVGSPGSHENAQALLEDIQGFMNEHSSTAARNMHIPTRNRSTRQESHDNDTFESNLQHLANDEDDGFLVDDSDRRMKNVDSGRVAMIITSDTSGTFSEKWSGTSKERRRWAANILRADTTLGAKLVFVEVIVTNERLIVSNMLSKQAATAGKTESEKLCKMLETFRRNSQQFRRLYVTLQEDGSEADLSYIQLHDYGRKSVTNRMHGYLRMRIAQFLTTLHASKHTIYLSRHGQSEYNVLGKIGGNPPLSPAGEEYARRLAKWAPANVCYDEKSRMIRARLWTSSLQRTILTANLIPHHRVLESDLDSAFNEENGFQDGSQGDMVREVEVGGVWEQMSPRVYRNLDEIFAGEYEGMNYEDIKKLNPDEASLRAMDKLGYRYPRGESYLDLISRLDPLIHEIESYHEPLLIVSHQAVLRMLYSYLTGKPRHTAPRVDVPLHTVIKITYDAWNPVLEERFVLGPEPDSVDNQSADDGQKEL